MKKYILLIFSFLAVASCDMLTEKPTTSYTGTAAYETPDALEAAVYGLYRKTFSSTASTTMFYNFGCASRFIQWKSGNRTGRQYEQYLRGTLYADQNEGNSILRTQFSAIQSCNLIIEGLKTSPVDEAYKVEIEAEARMLRAVNYFFAVRMFGDLPLFTRPIKSDADAFVKRTSFKKIYAQIEEDLKYASLNMRSPARQEEVTGRNGRANNYAAKAFLAQVYLQIGSLLESPDDQAFGTIETGEVKPDFSEMGISSANQAFRLALDMADDVIFNGPYILEKDYRTLFNWEPSSDKPAYDSKERIFVMQNTPNGGTDARFTMNTLPNFMFGTRQGESLYTCSTAGYIRPSRIVLNRWINTYGDGTSCMDPRYQATYITNYKVTASSSGTKYDPPRDVATYPANDTDPYFRKYFSSTYNSDACCADFYVLRLAEIYLVAAEASACLGESGRKGDAYDYIEELHKRARDSKDGEAASQPMWTRGQFSGKEDLITAIFWETIYETHGEGQEWFNAHRHGATWLVNNVYEPMHQFLMQPEQSSYRNQWWYNIGYQLPRSVHNARCGLLCEYPDYEITYNRALGSEDQNYYNNKIAEFIISDSADSNNESYDENENIFPW